MNDEALLKNKEFWKNKRVLITGNTGFKGTWLASILTVFGAKVFGYALEPVTNPNIFKLSNINEYIDTRIGDIRDLVAIKRYIQEIRPEFVFHMAAQPLVRESYINPVYTYETNVIGTVNLLEAVRHNDYVASIINVTTDKVYQNDERKLGYKEADNLCGYDPYSNSKSCSELVTYSYRNSFFHEQSHLALSTARAGNVLAGGDFSANRVIPDCINAAIRGEKIIIRNPDSVRPYQHVLDCLAGYLILSEKQFVDRNNYEGSYNFGPEIGDCITTGKLASIFCNKWGGSIVWQSKDIDGPHESGILMLDNTKAKETLHWYPKWNVETAVEKTVEWTKHYIEGKDVLQCMISQIEEYFLISGR